MEVRLLFVVPFVIAVSGILFLMSISFGMPKFLTVTFGGLQQEDLRRLTPEQRKGLRGQTFQCVPLSAAITLIPGLAIFLIDIQINMIVTVICLIIQFVATTILLTPLFKLAKSIKTKLDAEAKSVDNPAR